MKLKDQMTYDYIKKVKKRMYCPNCLEYQFRYDKTCDTWRCDTCGYELSEKEFEDDYVFWFCDGCGAYLNAQKGFEKASPKHVCNVCGFENDTTESNIKGECKDCGKLLENPDDSLCPDCRKKRIQTALIATAIVGGVVAVGIGVSQVISNKNAHGVRVPDMNKETEDNIVQNNEVINDLLDISTSNLDNVVQPQSKTIYITNEYNGYGKQNYYRYIYNLEGEKVVKYRRHRFKFFDGDENFWEQEEKFIQSWDIGDPEMPEWLNRYIE